MDSVYDYDGLIVKARFPISGQQQLAALFYPSNGRA